MKEIGGYFELELALENEYHKDAIKLNSGRNAFKYLLRAQGVKKVYLPNLICDSMVDPLQKLDIAYDFYHVDNQFEIVNMPHVGKHEKLIYVNYYSLKSEYLKDLVSRYADDFVVDNTQAFFEKPVNGVDTIYSPRKFFGVCDGGYLYTREHMENDLQTDVSHDSMLHLLGRIDVSASSFYDFYQAAEDRLKGAPVRAMSKVTSKILSSIDYDDAIRKRKDNYFYLHNELKHINHLTIDFSCDAPFVYPFMTDNMSIRDVLISKKIYVAKYWDEVLTRPQVSNIECDLVNKIIPLPIDQRYSLEDMRIIIEIIMGEYEQES